RLLCFRVVVRLSKKPQVPAKNAWPCSTCECDRDRGTASRDRSMRGPCCVPHELLNGSIPRQFSSDYHARRVPSRHRSLAVACPVSDLLDIRIRNRFASRPPVLGRENL